MNKEHIFKQWLADHKGIVLKVARSFTETPDDLNDLFQEILLQIWTTLPKYRSEAKPSTWIYKVALNRALTYDRSEKRRKGRQVPLVELPDTQANQEVHRQLNRLYSEIRKLDEIDRSLILLHLDGFSYKEIAITLDISETNVGVRLNRSKQKLAQQMKEPTHEF